MFNSPNQSLYQDARIVRLQARYQQVFFSVFIPLLSIFVNLLLLSLTE